MSYRVGIGFDIHRLVPGRELVLGGVKIPFDQGLLGHSDGDVVIHAICDAILGALARQDIGAIYPDTAQETKGMYSRVMLEEIAGSLSTAYEIVNVDVNCICEKPKLAPFREEMIRSIANACRIDETTVSVKFRTHEGIGEIGRSEAIAAQAAVLLKHIVSDLEE